jgi:hypothetical protein
MSILHLKHVHLKKYQELPELFLRGAVIEVEDGGKYRK